MTTKDLKEMKLHSIKTVDNFTQILRVSGSWIYNQMIENQDGSWNSSSTFVPEFLNCNIKNN